MRSPREDRRDVKDWLIELAGVFLPGVPKSRRQKELEYTVKQQEQRVERRRRARVGAQRLANAHPAANDYSDWMNLERKDKNKRKRDEDN